MLWSRNIISRSGVELHVAQTVAHVLDVAASESACTAVEEDVAERVSPAADCSIATSLITNSVSLFKVLVASFSGFASSFSTFAVAAWLSTLACFVLDFLAFFELRCSITGSFELSSAERDGSTIRPRELQLLVPESAIFSLCVLMDVACLSVVAFEPCERVVISWPTSVFVTAIFSAMSPEFLLDSAAFCAALLQRCLARAALRFKLGGPRGGTSLRPNKLTVERDEGSHLRSRICGRRV
jgi:hypothetical protein